jgi:hypothetical protein
MRDLPHVANYGDRGSETCEREGACVLGPSSEIDDEHHEQDDDEKTDQSVAGSGDCKHCCPPFVMDAKKLPLPDLRFEAFANAP